MGKKLLDRATAAETLAAWFDLENNCNNQGIIEKRLSV